MGCRYLLYGRKGAYAEQKYGANFIVKVPQSLRKSWKAERKTECNLASKKIKLHTANYKAGSLYLGEGEGGAARSEGGGERAKVESRGCYQHERPSWKPTRYDETSKRIPPEREQPNRRTARSGSRIHPGFLMIAGATTESKKRYEITHEEIIAI